MRAINAIRELNDERDEPIQVIALYTETERHALFVRQADERHCLGPAMVENGDGRHSAYLDYELLERALVETQADAAWVGWGFVAEHPAFAELCERLGIVFVGPDADVMRALGDKIEAKRLAEQAGVPVAAWSGGPVESAEDAVRQGEAIGFPLMIKAAAGGGGRGMRRVEDAADLADAFERARAEAAAGVRRSERADRERDRERAPRRGPADGRRAGRGVGAGRARLQLPAPPPEGGRGVGQPGPHARAGARAGRVGGAPGAQRELPRRRHRRVPLRARGPALLVHGGQRAPAGRAPRHRDGHRRRPRAAPAPRRGRRPARGRPAATERPRHRGAPERRGPRHGVRARPRADHAAAPPVRARRARRHRRRRGRLRAARVRLDDRQDHRPRPQPRSRRSRACAARSPTRWS